MMTGLERGEMPRKIVFRRISALVLVGGIFSTLLAGCSGQKEERAYEPKARQPTTSEDFPYEFVGEAFGAKELVAVVADKTVAVGTTNRTVGTTNKTVAGTDKTVAAGGGRRVRAYVCDGEPQGDAEWFTGQMTGNAFDLTSVSGKARLQAELTEKEATGAVTLADGSLYRFSAPATRDGAGLYEVTIGRDGRRSGTSANGAKDEGQVSRDGVLTTGTIRLPSGEAIDYRMRETIGYEGSSKPDTYTTIILPGAAKERGRGGDVKTNRPSSNFISNDLDL
jgi:hypothetical protein